MHVGLFIDAKLPPRLYGGTERWIIWHGRALVELGHKVTFFAHEGTRLDFADVIPASGAGPDLATLPTDLSILHYVSGWIAEDLPVPACHTIQGNTRNVTRFHPNSIFVSRNHAKNHNAEAFVYNGMDARSMPEPDLETKGGHLTFLAKAAWKVKNVKGAIAVARKAGVPIDILGGHRLNFKMGFRITLDPNARFHGMVDDEQKARFLRSARGLLFPVRWNEPFGIAIAEAMYFGCPVFGTPYGSLPELIPPETGFLSSSASELAEAAKSAGSYDRHAIHAHWRENFTSKKQALKYIAFYERILDGETLHPGGITSPPTRTKELLPWCP